MEQPPTGDDAPGGGRLRGRLEAGLERWVDRTAAELDERAAELVRRRAEIAAAEEALARREAALQARDARLAPVDAGPAAHLLFVRRGDGYALDERDGPPPAVGTEVALGDGDARWVVVKLGPSPLPADTRPCAFLERYFGSGSSLYPTP